MSGEFTIFDSKEDLFLAYDMNEDAWMWTNFDRINEEDGISYSSVGEYEIEVFWSRVKNKKRYRKDFCNLIIAAKANVWLVTLINDYDDTFNCYGIDYTDGIKI